MKAFVYSKKTSKLVKEVDYVQCVLEDDDNGRIVLLDANGESHPVETKKYKTTIYKN